MYEQESLMDLLKENVALAKENNKLLKAMRRDAFIGGALRIILWLAVLGSSYFLAIQYLQPLLSTYSGGEGMEGMDFKALLEQYRSLGE